MGIPSQVDYLVMGAGVAGLRAAIDLAEHGEVLVVTKESLGESNTHYAQGGIAVAMEGNDDVALHLEDTVAAGDGLVYRPAAEVLVAEGPMRVTELIEWGARFDCEAGKLLRTREGAHSHPRILHANGDATGAEISRSLVAMARGHARIHFAEWTMVTGLIVEDGRVIAADLASADGTGEKNQQRLRCARSADRGGWRGTGLFRHNKPRRGYGRRHRPGGRSRRGTGRHGVLPVSPNGIFAAWCTAFSAV